MNVVDRYQLIAGRYFLNPVFPVDVVLVLNVKLTLTLVTACHSVNLLGDVINYVRDVMVIGTPLS